MADVKVYFLQPNGEVLVDQVFDLFGVAFHSFAIGDESGFVPFPTEYEPRGNPTFIGDYTLISTKRSDDNMSFSVSMSIPEIYDNISVGNIVVYSKVGEDTRPVFSIVLPEVVYKQNMSPNALENPLFRYPGNRLEVVINVKYVTNDELTADVILQTVTPGYSNLPFFGKQSEIPTSPLNPYPQFVVHEMASDDSAPALVIKDHNDQYWGSPLWQDIDSPKFGVINYIRKPERLRRARWLWSGRYTDDIANKTKLGQASYETSNLRTIRSVTY